MPNKKYLSVLLWFFAIVLALFLIYQGYIIDIVFFRAINLAIGATILGLPLFENLLWKFQIFRPWPISIPNLSGTWEGEIISNWVEPDSPQKFPAIKAYLIIRQTFSTIHVTLVTQQSSSNLLSGKLYPKDDVYQLVGIYMNISKQSYRQKSPIHYGGLLLNIYEKDVMVLEGSYWTDRCSDGEIKFSRRIKKVCSNFENCESNFQ